MDIVANIHYGYVEKEIDFADVLLYSTAGIAQQLGPHPELGRWWAYGDQPDDFYPVALGIHMQENYGTNMSYDEFVYVINLWVDNGWLDEYIVP